MKKLILSTLFMLTYSATVYAGWFGPSNYEECMLDTMKGQDRSMYSVAADACEKKFPFERELDFVPWEILTWSVEGKTLSITIVDKTYKYKITRMIIKGITKKCADVTESDKKDGKRLIIKFDKNEYGAVAVDADDVQCIYQDSVTGMYRK